MKKEELGMCYIESKNLDGETNLKFKQANIEISQNYLKEEDLSNLGGTIECTPPNDKLNDFGAKFYENQSDYTNFIIIDKQSLLLRGCVLKKTQSVYGIATYIGHKTKMIMNFPTFKYKLASIESKLSIPIFIFILIALLICFIRASTFINKLYKGKSIREINIFHAIIRFLSSFARNMTNFGNIVSISLYAILEVIKYIQV